MIVRTLDRKQNHARTRGHVTKCDICLRGTREGKPYCTEHITHADYVQGIIQALEAQEEEHRKVSKRGMRAIKKNSLTVEELIKTIFSRGTATIERLSREMNLDYKLIETYSKYLARHKLARLGQSRRGSTTVTLAEEAPKS